MRRPIRTATPVNVRISNELLDAYLRKSLAEMVSKAWLSEPNNLISAVAIVISIFGVIYGFLKDRKDMTDRDLAALTAIINDVTKLDTDVYTATLQAHSDSTPLQLQNYLTTIGNRKEALLAEADRLTISLGEKIPSSQLAVLGASYFQVGQFEKAKMCFGAITGAKSSNRQRINGWRSIATTNYIQGPTFYKDAQMAYANAALVDPNAADQMSVQDNIRVLREWGQFEISTQAVHAGVLHLLAARQIVKRLPCQKGYVAFAAKADEELLQSIPLESVAEITFAREQLDAIHAHESCRQ